MKTVTFETLGFFSGMTLTIIIDWSHIAERAFETGVIALIGGAFGALGGLIVAWFFKKFFKIEKK